MQHGIILKSMKFKIYYFCNIMNCDLQCFSLNMNTKAMNKRTYKEIKSAFLSDALYTPLKTFIRQQTNIKQNELHEILEKYDKLLPSSFV